MLVFLKILFPQNSMQGHNFHFNYLLFQQICSLEWMFLINRFPLVERILSTYFFLPLQFFESAHLLEFPSFKIFLLKWLNSKCSMIVAKSKIWILYDFLINSLFFKFDLNSLAKFLPSALRFLLIFNYFRFIIPHYFRLN